MGWNEPPKNGKDRDPWGDRDKGDNPPDLDEVLRKIQKGFGGLFGNQSNSSDNHHPVFPFIPIIIVLICWLVYDMTYFIDEQERGVAFRFGKHVATLNPGLNIRLPRPIEKVTKVNVGQVRTITHKALMLTQDENIVDVEVAVQWRIGEATDYLFNVYDPASTLRQVTESAVREIIGKSKLDFVLTAGRSEITENIQLLIQQTLVDYVSGIYITTVEMQPAKPPEEVKAAFDDAIKAREDEQRLVNEAEAYRNDILPKARGAAARLREESNGYKSRIISKAEGEASRFEQLLAEYERAPEVTRERLYLDTIESVFSNTNKVLIDGDNSNSLMYLPIDQLIKQQKNNRRSDLDSNRSSNNSSTSLPSRNDIKQYVDGRLREIR